MRNYLFFFMGLRATSIAMNVWMDMDIKLLRRVAKYPVTVNFALDFGR